MKISVIVPVFNVSHYVSECLESIKNQSFKGLFECILVEDCSTDNSLSVVESFLSDYRGNIRFRLIRHEHNKGLSAARNTGTSVAIGDYIFYVDSDDTITPDCLEKMAKAAAAYPDAEMVVGNIVSANRPYQVTESNAGVRSDYFEDSIFPVTAWNKLVKRCFLLDNAIFFREGVYHEDFLWTFYLMKRLNKVVYLPDISYNYRQRPYSITSGNNDELRARSYCAVFSEVLDNLTAGKEREEYDYYVGSFISFYIMFARYEPASYDLFRRFWSCPREIVSLKNRLEMVLGYFLAKTKNGRKIHIWILRKYQSIKRGRL